MITGALQLDRRVTDKMLRWVLVDIKRNKQPPRKGIMTIRDDHVKFISHTDSSDVLLEHNVHSISQFCRCQRDRRCLFYLQRNAIDAPFVMFAFTCDQEDKVGFIYTAACHSYSCRKCDTVTYEALTLSGISDS